MVGLALGMIGQTVSGLMSAQARQGEFQEQLRRLKMEKTSAVGLAVAKTGASGVDFGSASSVKYLAGLGAEFDLAMGNLQDTARLTQAADYIGVASGLVSGGSKLGSNIWQLSGK